MSYPVPHLGVGTALLLVAAVADIRNRRIPNLLNGALLVAGVASQASVNGSRGALSGVAAAVLLVIGLWRPWQKGRIGGGDVKMAAAAAAWTGLGLAVPYLLATALAGGLVALVCGARSSRQAQREMQANLVAVAAGLGAPEVAIRGGAGRVSVPYGVAVAAGALAVLWWR
jgi:prepilin peptidase CpaA